MVLMLKQDRKFELQLIQNALILLEGISKALRGSVRVSISISILLLLHMVVSLKWCTKYYIFV